MKDFREKFQKIIEKVIRDLCTKKSCFFGLLFLITFLLRTKLSNIFITLVGIPLFKDIHSSILNDVLICTIVIGISININLWYRKREKDFNIIPFIIALNVTIIYFWHRQNFQEFYVPFKSLDKLYYVDSLYLLFIESLMYWGWSSYCKKSNSIRISNPIIENYLKEKPVNYAMMIEGEWGSGKSYYWHNTLVPELDKAGYQIVYTSLFGIKDVIQLRESIINQLHPIATHPIWNIIISKLAKWMGLDWSKNDNITIFESLEFDSSKVVFCFDDIERTMPKELESILGYINNFIERGSSHVFLICNERKIETKFQDTTHTYNEYREKLVRKIYKYQGNFSQSFDNIFIKGATLPKFIRNSLREYTKTIYKEFHCNNLRIVEFNLSILKRIWPIISDSKYIYSAIIERYYTFLAALYCITYMEHGTEMLTEISALTSKSSLDLDLDFGFDNKESPKVITKEQIENNKIISCTKDALNKIEHCEYGASKVLITYICEGKLDEESLNNEINNIINSYLKPESEIYEPNHIIDTLMDVSSLEDDELDEIVNDTITKIENGNIAFSFYPRIFQLLTRLRNKEIISLDNDSKLKDKFLKGLEKASYELDEPNIRQIYNTSDFNDASDECKEIIHAVIQRKEEYDEKERLSSFKESLFNPSQWDKLNSLEDYHYKLYEGIDATSFFDLFITTTNDNKSKWINSLNKDLEHRVCSKEEYPFLIKMKELCSKYCEKKQYSISRKYCQNTIKIIDKFLPPKEETKTE